MYNITRQVVKHSKDLSPISTPFATVNCSREELINVVLSMFSNLAEAENLTYRHSGSSTRVQFKITDVKGIELGELIDCIKLNINHKVKLHNETINDYNSFHRRNNKKLYKPIDENCKDIVNIKDLIPVFIKPWVSKDIDTHGYIVTEGED